MFGKQKASEKPIETQWEREQRYRAELDEEARAAEPDALAKADALLVEAIAEHEKDAASYRFECRRWGDFLSLFIGRTTHRGVGDWRGWQQVYSPETYATSINIRETREIRLDRGNEPDRNGRLEYYVSHSVGDNRVMPSYPRPQMQRHLFLLDPPPRPESEGLIYSCPDIGPRYATPNYPRVAGDDQIRFEGVGATLFVPAGLGQKVYDQILQEIASAS